jgi:hypothetical protein
MEQQAEKKTAYTHAEWLAEAKRRFGKSPAGWKFVCPSCGYVASGQEYKDAGAPIESIGFSCVGRWKLPAKQAFDPKGKGPCNYAGGGLIRLNPVKVVTPDGSEHEVFEFA